MSERLSFDAGKGTQWVHIAGSNGVAIRVNEDTGEVWMDEAACEAVIANPNADRFVRGVCRVALAARDGRIKSF